MKEDSIRAERLKMIPKWEVLSFQCALCHLLYDSTGSSPHVQGIVLYNDHLQLRKVTEQ